MNKNYFMLPNEIFNLGLNSTEISIYAYLVRLENRKTFTCYPSYNSIARALNCTANTVRKYVYSLVDKGFITTENTHIFTADGRKMNGSLMYNIRPIYEVIELYNQMKLKEIAI